jgi:hypothetical protein
VPVRAWNNAQKGTWGLPLPVKLECRDMTNTVSMWRKTQNKNKQKVTIMIFACLYIIDFAWRLSSVNTVLSIKVNFCDIVVIWLSKESSFRNRKSIASSFSIIVWLKFGEVCWGCEAKAEEV